MGCYIVVMTYDGLEYRFYRKALGLTQQRLAHILGIGRDTIVARETGKSRVTREHFLALDGVQATLETEASP